MKEHSIKQIVWGFQNIIYNSNSEQRNLQIIRRTLVSLFNSTVEALLPFKFFVRCVEKDSEVTICIFDTEQECDNWINNKPHWFVSCDKITFEEFDKYSKNSWRKFTNYLQEVDCVYLNDGEDYKAFLDREYKDPLEFVLNHNDDYDFENDIDDDTYIKGMVWGFRKIIENLDFQITSQKIIGKSVINLFYSTVVELMPHQFFACCDNIDEFAIPMSQLFSSQIFIFDREDECDEWIENHQKWYRHCDKISFDDVDKISESGWKNWTNYSSEEFCLELGEDYNDPLQLDVEWYEIYNESDDDYADEEVCDNTNSKELTEYSAELLKEINGYDNER